MDILVISITLLLAMGLAVRLVKIIPNSYKAGVWVMLFMHLLTCIGFYFVTRNGGGDAWSYWEAGKQLDVNSAIPLLFEAKGTYFIHGFNYFFSGFLGIGFFANTCIYAFFGYWGLLYFYQIAIEQVPFNSIFLNLKIFPLLFYFPMLHFWSSGIGKDTLLFLAIGMFAYGMLCIHKRLLLIIFGLLFAYFVRPHIALLLIVAHAGAYLLDSRATAWKRLSLGVVMLAGAVAILPMVLEYVKIDDVSLQSISEYSDNKAGKLSRAHTGSSIDISSYPLPVKWFTFLFRPLFFDINGIPALVASFENVFLLLLFLKVMMNKPFLAFREAPFVIKGLTLFLILGTLLMSGALGNLGIMIRMRNMFLPGMLLYFLWVLSYAKQQNDFKEKIT